MRRLNGVANVAAYYWNGRNVAFLDQSATDLPSCATAGREGSWGQRAGMFAGPIDQLPSYPFYGAPIYAVADGRVANALATGCPSRSRG
jgi:hypothetical protein